MKPKIQRLKAKYRYSMILLRELVVSDFKLRYQNSALGYVWSLLKPFSLFLILYVVFVKVVKSVDGIPHPGVYLLIGIVIWNYFTEVTNGSIGAIVGRGDLLRKVNFPRYVIIVSGSISAIINLFFNTIVIAIFILLAKISIGISILWVPIILVELFVFSLAIGFLLSALFVRFRDVGFIWEVGMQGAFFATPIMYGLAQVTSKSLLAAKILMLNPVAQIMQGVRYVIIPHPKVQTITSIYGTKWAVFLPLGIVLLFTVISTVYFKRRSPYFAEEV